MSKSWTKKDGPQGDICLGTRIRLARNLEKTPFPATANRDQARQVMHTAKKLAESLNQLASFRFYELAEVDQLERQILMEKHLISPEHTKKTSSKGLILSENEDISIMVNEEDHFRIQVLLPGLQLKEAWELADRVDDLIEANVDYAFDPEIGYLTACPTNVGTGMRGSLMLHLPALARIKQLGNVLKSVSQFGLAVRGLYGEGSESYGSIYQISNQVSLGHSESEMLEHMGRVTKQVIASERQAREYLQEHNRTESEDQIYRAYGLLSQARIISTQEAMDLLSTVLLGIDLGMIQDLDRGLVKKLMVEIRSAHLQKMMGQSLPAQERDRLRGSMIRDRLNR